MFGSESRGREGSQRGLSQHGRGRCVGLWRRVLESGSCSCWLVQEHDLVVDVSGWRREVEWRSGVWVWQQYSTGRRCCRGPNRQKMEVYEAGCLWWR
jgi:hypothetical protein